MKKFLILLFCIILTFTMVACGDQGDGSDTAADPGTDTEAGEDAEAEDPGVDPETHPEGDMEASTGDMFTFATETFEGEAFTSEDIKDAKLVMINFWEPWCNPCVNEMPDLEQVYEEYKDQGFLILGAFSDTSQDGEVKSLLDEFGTSYPILRYCLEFDSFQTGYVPTTVFMTGEGKVLTSDPIVGSQTYDQWKATVEEMLKKVN